MNPAQFPSIANGFLWESLDEGCLLYHEESGKMITLNQEAEIVLSHCTGEFSLPDLIDTLEKDFAMPAEATRAALRQLEQEAVIEPLK
jgi:hypothetical protein